MRPNPKMICLLLTLVLLGCREKLPEGLYRAESSKLSKDERLAVAAAKAAIEKDERKSVDARYKISRVPEGYKIHASFVAGYNHGQPIFIAGGFCEVLVSTNMTVIKIFPGA